jgi:molybdopterin-guanine dinucleotide biosynthesis protein B
MKPVIAVFGKKNSGKTRLIERLIRDLESKGYNIAVVKHVHHGDFEVDIEGKDTWRFMKAGAKDVAGISDRRLYINRSLKGYPDIDRILEEFLSHNDIVFIEGFRFLFKDSKDIHKIIVGGKADYIEASEPILSIYRDEKDYNVILDKIISLLRNK